MQDVQLDYGDAKMAVELPDSATVIRYGVTYDDPPSVDAREATVEALQKPLGMPRLRELASSTKKAVIGFPDRVKGGAHPDAHRRVAIPLIVEELVAGGMPIENITLLCAVGLHRKNTLEEWYSYLGKSIVDKFYPDRIVNHDAEAADIVELGTDEMGNHVDFNRLMAEADIPIVVGHCSGNPYGGFSGGYKMVVTGHTTARSIAGHHTPETMHRDDWLGAHTCSLMRRQFESIGKAIERGIGKPIFAVDAVLGQKSQVLQVAAGRVEEVEKATWPLAERRTNVDLGRTEPYDVLVMGLPRNFHYGPGMGTNPILSGLAIGGQLSRCWRVLRPGCVVIAACLCDGWFNPGWFPSYEESYEALQEFTNATEFLASPRAGEIAERYEYRHSYSTRHTYHPFHAMSMISGGAIVGQRTAAAIMVAPKMPRYARGMGYVPVKDFTEAMELASRYVGRNPRVLCTPECFSGGVAVHLR
ncbi:MAG: DUF2088 domain-containing protein [Spirochaetaceae bacterium]|nr:MAG: DUF2088 domain-containing protein [Spirochaetaceae bacterium]